MSHPPLKDRLESLQARGWVRGASPDRTRYLLMHGHHGVAEGSTLREAVERAEAFTRASAGPTRRKA